VGDYEEHDDQEDSDPYRGDHCRHPADVGVGVGTGRKLLVGGGGEGAGGREEEQEGNDVEQHTADRVDRLAPEISRWASSWDK